MLKRIAAGVGVAAEGIPLSAPLLIAGIVLLAIGYLFAGIPLIVAAAAVLAFFRDPEREAPVASAGAVVSGADGRVCEVSRSAIPGSDSDAVYQRVSVFMSPFDVHVNRAPAAGEVTSVRHTCGEFRAAFRDTASEHNERNMIRIRDSFGREHVMVQVAGYLARRIVCRVRPHQRLELGQRIGLIMFGSRVDHFFPGEYRVTVELGRKVRAGETIIGEPQN